MIALLAAIGAAALFIGACVLCQWALWKIIETGARWIDHGVEVEMAKYPEEEGPP